MTTKLSPSRRTEHVAAPRSSRRWWVAAVLVALAGLIVGAAWAAAGLVAQTQRPDDFARAPLPGRVAVDLAAGEHAVAYVEASEVDALRSADVAVRGPDGAPVATRAYPGVLQYDVSGGPGLLGHAVLTFDAPAAGGYTVTAAAPAAGTVATLAVGDDLAEGTVGALIPPILLTLGTLALAGVIAATPTLRSAPH